MSLTALSYRFCKLTADDLDEILQIEEQVYSHPWTRGNFEDSLSSGYEMCGLRTDSGSLQGYFLAMLIVDEVHLLNLAVSSQMQRQGLACALLDRLCSYTREQQASSILLEVRTSNQRAFSVYKRYGFEEIGRRKAYYPAENNTREDAIVMRMEL